MDKVDTVEIGARIRKQRIELGLTQQNVYEQLDISQNHYSRIENGHAGTSVELLLRICEVLQVSADYILTGKLGASEQTEFIKRYNSLTPKQKEYIENHIELFCEYNFK